MRILYIITSLEGGGAQNLLIDVCKVLKENHKITIAYLLDLQAYEKQLQDMGIETIFVDSKKMGVLRAISKVRNIIKEYKIDLVHTHLPAADTIGRIAGILTPGLRIVSTIHGEDEWKKSGKLQFRILRLFNRLSINLFKRVELISVSNSAKEYCIKYEKIARNKITVIYNFVDFGNPVKSDSEYVAAQREPGQFVMINVARLEPEKAHLLLLEAIKKLCEKNKNVLLHILGVGKEQANIEAFIAGNNLSAHVKLWGYRKNIYDYIKDADLFILSSYCEGQSIALLESFYCGTPVLASGISANSEILQGGENGVLFKTGDPEDLAEKVIKIMDGEYDTDAMVKHADTFCRQLSIERHIEKLEQVYHKKD